MLAYNIHGGVLKNSRGMGSVLTILGSAIAAAIIVFPLARWQMSLSDNTASVSDSLDNAGIKLEMISALEDRWRLINDMNIEAFKVATDKTTKYGKYTVSESYGALGIYNEDTGNCDSGTPGDNDKACRVATLTVTGPENVLPLGPVKATRVASSSGGKFLREPDFSSSKYLISGKNWSYTLEEDGWVEAYTSHCCSSGYVQQNGRTIVALLNDPSTSYSDSDQVLVPAKKGDVFVGRVTMSSHGSGSNSLYFYPYRK